MKEFWIMFFRDSSTGSIHGVAIGHNCIADYRKYPFFIGATKISISLEELDK